MSRCYLLSLIFEKILHIHYPFAARRDNLPQTSLVSSHMSAMIGMLVLFYSAFSIAAAIDIDGMHIELDNLPDSKHDFQTLLFSMGRFLHFLFLFCIDRLMNGLNRLNDWTYLLLKCDLFILHVENVLLGRRPSFFKSKDFGLADSYSFSNANKFHISTLNPFPCRIF